MTKAAMLRLLGRIGPDPDRDRIKAPKRSLNMLDKDQIAAASRTLRDHWRAGTKFENLDPSLRPHDGAQGYAIQALLENASSKGLFGWKIAATSEAGQKHIDVAGPMAGRILAETVLARWRHGVDGRQ